MRNRFGGSLHHGSSGRVDSGLGFSTRFFPRPNRHARFPSLAALRILGLRPFDCSSNIAGVPLTCAHRRPRGRREVTQSDQAYQLEIFAGRNSGPVVAAPSSWNEQRQPKKGARQAIVRGSRTRRSQSCWIFGVKAHIARRALVAPRNATMRSTPFQGSVAHRGRNGLFHRGAGHTAPRVAIVKLASCVE
jgi:hypothetical protein